jgi:hypothetical protein
MLFGRELGLINPRRGIFKPRQMVHLLSIKTVFPRRGARVWYDDQREAHRQIYSGDDVVDYAFMGTDPNSPDNRWFRDAMQRQIPVICFLGTAPGRYQPIIPTFIVGWHPERLRVDLAFGVTVGASAQAALPSAPERRYALRETISTAVRTTFGGNGSCNAPGAPAPKPAWDARCLWCDQTFTPRSTGGSAQKFCCTGHRQQFWIAARRRTMRAIEAGLLSVDCLKASRTSVHAA